MNLPAEEDERPGPHWRQKYMHTWELLCGHTATSWIVMYTVKSLRIFCQSTSIYIKILIKKKTAVWPHHCAAQHAAHTVLLHLLRSSSHLTLNFSFLIRDSQGRPCLLPQVISCNSIQRVLPMNCLSQCLITVDYVIIWSSSSMKSRFLPNAMKSWSGRGGSICPPSSLS